MSTDQDKEQLLRLLRLDDNKLWNVLDDLGNRLLKPRSPGQAMTDEDPRALGEKELRIILRPHDEAGFHPEDDKALMVMRERLDQSLDVLLLAEIGCEISLIDVGDLAPLRRMTLRALCDSESFLRYLDVYLYFGVRILFGRLFPPTWWPDELVPRKLDGSADSRQMNLPIVPDPTSTATTTAANGTTGIAPPPPPPRFVGTKNKRLLTLPVPPSICLGNIRVGRHERNSLERFSRFDKTSAVSYALRFLDDFHERPPKPPESTSSASLTHAGEKPDIASQAEQTAKTTQTAQAELYSSEGPARFELWLRGMSPETGPVEEQRFQAIMDGLLEWIRSRTEFYSAFLPDHVPQPGSNDIPPDFRPQGGWNVDNPLTARFALADIYWLSRLLRADVSANASVTYPRTSWMHLLRFRSTLRDQDHLSIELRRQEEILRSVFDFVCDLAQNAVEEGAYQEQRHIRPSYYGGQPRHTRRWRTVFDEELEQIQAQRSRRDYSEVRIEIDPGLARELEISRKDAEGPPPRPKPLPFDSHPGWSERLVTGVQPHQRVGVALSGGGIRSATFSLGVLQGLQEIDLLRHVDYLSTVSGGGFIGAWLAGNVQRTKHWLGKSTNWDASVEHLRAYSNYLAPLNGILSADTWTIVASWVRNTFFIQTTCLVWLVSLLLVTFGALKIFVSLSLLDPQVGGTVFRGWALGGIDLQYLGLPHALVTTMVAITLIASFRGNRVETGLDSPRTATVRWYAVVPSWIGAFLLAVTLAHMTTHTVWTSKPSYKDFLLTAWQQLWPYIAFSAACLLAIGSVALTPTQDAAPGTTAFERADLGIGRAFWRCVLCNGVLYLALCAILYLFEKLPYKLGGDTDQQFAAIAFVFGPALVLLAFTLSVVLFIGLAGRRTNEAQREWWTRFGAWLTIYSALGLLLSAVTIYGPHLAQLLISPASSKWLGAIKWGGVASWIGTVAGGLFAGKSSKTSGENSSTKSKALQILAMVGGVLFIIGSVIVAATLLYIFLMVFSTGDRWKTSYWQVLNDIKALQMFEVLAALLLIGSLFSYFFEINIFGLNQFYRNRLVRCYLGATRWSPGLRRPHPFTKFDFQDDMPLSSLKDDFRGPFPILNCTLNLGGSSELALHTRHSASFSLTPLRCGADRPRVGYAPTAPVKGTNQSFADGIKLGQAVSISGAAASPNMGYNTSPIVAFLLTMFNVRLGWWFPNPGKKSWKARGLPFSLGYLISELLGAANENRDFLNVSDGGHFENLGIYELIRRRCKVIIACDAECDELLQFGGLGNMLRICETDFGAVIDMDVKSIRMQKEGSSLAHCAVGKIKYSNGSLGYLIYLKASITGDEDVSIAQYRSAHPSFPHETTADQFFSEDQFESYRKLGQHVVRHSMRGTQVGDHPVTVAEKLADVLSPAGCSSDVYLKHNASLYRIWENFRTSPGLHPFLDELLRITPPAASITADIPPDRTSEELCMGLELIQLMADVFIDLRLDDFWDHPDNRGWAIMFMRFARSPRFRSIWKQVNRTYGIRFEYFCDARLNLQMDKPIVRV